MRWWLAAVFVAIATLTAVLIAAVSSRQADRELRANAENIALGAGHLGPLGGRAGDHRRQPRRAAPVDRRAAQRRAVRLLAEAATARAGHYKNVRWQDVPEGGAAVLTRARQPAVRRRLPRRPLDPGRAAARSPQQRRGARRVRAAPALRAVARDLPARRHAGLDLGRRGRGAHGADRGDADRAAPQAHLELGRRRSSRATSRASSSPGCTTRSASSR